MRRLFLVCLGKLYDYHLVKIHDNLYHLMICKSNKGVKARLLIDLRAENSRPSLQLKHRIYNEIKRVFTPRYMTENKFNTVQ